uniref:Uncharacterized protein n=1 Tax=Odontella aurita TaxID=265563 RepID=A0A7S4I4I9_9STRA
MLQSIALEPLQRQRRLAEEAEVTTRAIAEEEGTPRWKRRRRAAQTARRAPGEAQVRGEVVGIHGGGVRVRGSKPERRAQTLAAASNRITAAAFSDALPLQK